MPGTTKIKHTKFSCHKETEQFIMVCSLLRQNFYHRFFSHEYFQPLTFPKLWYIYVCIYVLFTLFIHSIYIFYIAFMFYIVHEKTLQNVSLSLLLRYYTYKLDVGIVARLNAKHRLTTNPANHVVGSHHIIGVNYNTDNRSHM